MGSNQVDVFSLPLGYTFNFSNGFGLIASLPLTYVETHYQDKTSIPSYQVSLGLGLRVPFNHFIHHDNRWDLTPIFRIGATGSDKDYSQIALLYSGGLLSEYYFRAFNLDISIRNLVSYYSTVPVSSNGWSTAYFNDFDNWLFKNGFRISSPISLPYIGDSLFGRALNASVWFNDTRLTGNNLFVNGAEEIGFDIGLLAKKADTSTLKMDNKAVEWVAKKASEGLIENELRLRFFLYPHRQGE